MNSYYDQTKATKREILYIVLLFIAGIFTMIACVWGMNALSHMYEVWASGKDGEAELARAESNRQIKTLEARAFEDSAKHLAQAEVIRADGVARANKIIGESLRENEAYLRYLWIQGLQSNQTQVIYVPTEANLPILEAGRL